MKFNYQLFLISHMIYVYVGSVVVPLRLYPLRWRHYGRDSVSNHQPHDCLLNLLFRRRSKKTSKLRVTGHLCGEFTGPRREKCFHLMTSSCLEIVARIKQLVLDCRHSTVVPLTRMVIQQQFNQILTIVNCSKHTSHHFYELSKYVKRLRNSHVYQIPW